MPLALSTLLRPSPIASSSRLLLSPLPRLSLPSLGFSFGNPQVSQVRWKGQLAPRRFKHRKAQKGHPHLPIGGSLKGTTVTEGRFGIRSLAPTRINANQIRAAEAAIKRKIKAIKGAELYLRVFPDMAVCVKGNETRMGKGKGGFDHWAARVPVGRVIFEVGGGGIREEIAKAALRLAQVKLPVLTEFVTSAHPPRLGLISDESLVPPTYKSSPANVLAMSAKNEGGTVYAMSQREQRSVEEVIEGLEGMRLGAKPAKALVEATAVAGAGAGVGAGEARA